MGRDADRRIALMGGAKALIKTALRRGLSKQKIIDELTRGMDHDTVVEWAEKYAGDLGLEVAEFLRMAGPRG